MKEKQNRKVLKLTKKLEWLIILASIFLITTIGMNIFANKPLSFGFKYVVMDAGTLISFIPFVISNVLIEAYGKEIAKKAIVFTGLTSFTFFIIAFIITYIPTTESYLEQSIHFSYIFNNGIRVIVASFISFIIGTYLNVYIIDKLKKKFVGDNMPSFFARSIFSSILGQFIDNLSFQVLAFAPIGISLYEMAWRDIKTVVIYTTIIELIMEMLFILPVTRKLSLYIKKMV